MIKQLLTFVSKKKKEMNRKLILTKAVNMLPIVLNDVKNINAGGCGLFAEHFYYFLQSIGFNPTLAIVTTSPQMTEEQLHNNGTPMYTPFNHIMIWIDEFGLYLDSNGIHTAQPIIYPKKSYGVVKGMDIQLLREWNKNEHIAHWNPTFNRKQVNKIKKGFKEVIEIFKSKNLVVSI